MSEYKNNTSEFVKECRELCCGYEDGWDSLTVPHPLAVCAHKLGEAADRLEAEIKRADDANKANLDKFRNTCSCGACQTFKGVKKIVTQEFTRLH